MSDARNEAIGIISKGRLEDMEARGLVVMKRAQVARLRAIDEAARELDAQLFIGDDWGVWTKGAGNDAHRAATKLRAALSPAAVEGAGREGK